MKDAVLEKAVINQEKGNKARNSIGQAPDGGQWLRVRPALRRTLAVTLIALAVLVTAGDTPHAAAMAGAAVAVMKVVPQYAQYLLDFLAAAAVLAVFCRAWRKPRSKQMATA
jgi:hypothetical protein